VPFLSFPFHLYSLGSLYFLFIQLMQKKILKKKHGEYCFACFMLVKYFVPLPPNISGPSSKTKKLKIKKKNLSFISFVLSFISPPPLTLLVCVHK